MYATDVGISPHWKNNFIEKLFEMKKDTNCSQLYLQDYILGHSADSIHIYAFVVITKKQLHTIRIRKCHNAVRNYWTLSLKKKIINKNS